MPPWRGCGRPHRMAAEEETTSVPLLEDHPPIPPVFFVPFVPQAGPFPPMSPKAFQDFIAYWYAKA